MRIVGNEFYPISWGLASDSLFNESVTIASRSTIGVYTPATASGDLPQVNGDLTIDGDHISLSGFAWSPANPMAVSARQNVTMTRLEVEYGGSGAVSFSNSTGVFLGNNTFEPASSGAPGLVAVSIDECDESTFVLGNTFIGCGLELDKTTAKVWKNTFEGNEANLAAIDWDAGTVNATASIRDNMIEGHSDGLRLAGQLDASIENNLIVHNSGNGIYSNGIVKLDVSKTTLSNNDRGFNISHSSPEIYDCIIASSSTLAMSTEGTIDGAKIHHNLWDNNGSSPFSGEIDEYADMGAGTLADVDPLFVSGPDHDFYLSTASAWGQFRNSPAIDAGATDMGRFVESAATNRAIDQEARALGFTQRLAVGCAYASPEGYSRYIGGAGHPKRVKYASHSPSLQAPNDCADPNHPCDLEDVIFTIRDERANPTTSFWDPNNYFEVRLDTGGDHIYPVTYRNSFTPSLPAKFAMIGGYNSDFTAVTGKSVIVFDHDPSNPVATPAMIRAAPSGNGPGFDLFVVGYFSNLVFQSTQDTDEFFTPFALTAYGFTVDCVEACEFYSPDDTIPVNQSIDWNGRANIQPSIGPLRYFSADVRDSYFENQFTSIGIDLLRYPFPSFGNQDEYQDPFILGKISIINNTFQHFSQVPHLNTTGYIDYQGMVSKT